MYPISLNRYDVCIYSDSRGQIVFLFGGSRDLWHCIFYHSFGFLGTNYCNIFYDCNSFGSLGEVFAHGGEFRLSFLIVVGLGHESRELLLARHCNHCLL